MKTDIHKIHTNVLKILGGYFYNGNISNLKLYSRALTDAEIDQNYNALKSRFGL